MCNRERSLLKCMSKIALATVLGFVLLISAASAQTTEHDTNKTHVSLTDISIRTAIKMLAKQLKLNVVFDDSFRDYPKYELELEDVTIETAMTIILLQNRLAARVIEENTLFITLDTETAQSRLTAYPRWSAKSIKNK
jgi:hypothetical protein